MSLSKNRHWHEQQECIPVRCVPPAAVAVRRGLHQAAPPREQAPPCGQTHTCKHITLPQTSFVGGKKTSVCLPNCNQQITFASPQLKRDGNLSVYNVVSTLPSTSHGGGRGLKSKV